ncbi:MAG: XdhC family protein, partial [Ignavibacteriales bacterium]|nr:XdhC family protein [Ignavibacteriales bacterium]
MSSIEFWQFTAAAIKEAGATALIKVVESKGSSPGKQKFMMAVTPAGKIAGTIGGGAMENKMINAAKDMLAVNSGSPVVQLMVHKKNVPDSSGLICSGSQTNAIIPLAQKDLGTIESIIAALQNRADGYLEINQSGLQYFMQTEQGVSTAFKVDEKGEWEYRERYGKSETVYVVGSGHVGLA